MQINESLEKTLPERRQLTVLFSDIVGSTFLSEQLDPEDLREVIRNYQNACTGAIFRYEGYLANFLGDGVLVFFGYPNAHEDDAYRAVQAGLDIIKSIKALSKPIEKEFGIALKVRIGIHTGLVIVGDIDKSDALESRVIFGQTPNLAARIQATAEPNTVHISADTHKLIRGYFDSSDLGMHSFKGISQAVTIYRVNRAANVSSRLDANNNQLIPFVGREAETGLLREKWQNVQAGKGQIVLLSGDAGIGKSRLVHSLKEYASKNSEFQLIELRSSPYHQTSSFYAIIDFLEHTVFQFEKNEGGDEKLAKIEWFLKQYPLALADSVPLIAALLSIPLTQEYTPPAFTPQRQKQKTIELLNAIFLHQADQKTVLFIHEDLHWIDPSSLEIIDQLIQTCGQHKILAVLIYRPHFKPAWQPRGNMCTIELTGLSETNASEIIGRISKAKALPSEAVKRIIEKTDGIPLFLEELTKSVIESDILVDKGDKYELSATFHSLGIPATIQDSLTARLDRFPQAKQVAQLASVIGREFSYSVLASIPGEHRENLPRYLNTLVEAGILFTHELPADTLYSFKHALIQDTAYSSLLKSARKSYHKLIAESIEVTSPELTETQPELIAQHYTKAAENEKAIPFWLAAGLRALQHSANLESIAHLKQGLELVTSVSEHSLRISFEMQLYSTLGPAIIATRGFGDAEVGDTYQKLSELPQLPGNKPHVKVALWGQWVYSLVRGNLATAHTLALEMKQTGQEVNDTGMLVEGHWMLGDTLFWLANFDAAQQELTKAIERYDPGQHHTHAYIYGQDPCVAAHCYQAATQWYLGNLDQAYAENAVAIQLANSLHHPFSIGWSLAFTFMVRMFGREFQEAKEWSERTIAYCTEQAYPFWINAATIVQGWATCMLGDAERGLPLIEKGLASWDEIGSMIVRPMFMGLYAEALGLGTREQTEKALGIVDTAIIVALERREIASELDLHRIQGELHKKNGNLFEAEASFRHGITLSDEFRSPSRKLQSATALYQLLKGTDREQEAADTLKSALAVFQEGFNRQIVKEAKALVERSSIH
ncbi:MAG: AAA family ATPase [Proteobacteria bacterium]|nr:AAA family ATPase [Pseudomonadota bacterium]